MNTELALDLARGLHLLGVILAMGAALYYDMRTLHRIYQPFSQNDLDELHRIHTVVSIAFASLWGTGIVLIWFRTGLDLDGFSPKLWSKLAVVTILMFNSILLSHRFIPALHLYIGKRLIDLPTRVLAAMSVSTGVSMSCWLLALALGSSQTLKTANWDVLLPIVLGGFALCICTTVALVFGIRAKDKAQHPKLQQQ